MPKPLLTARYRVVVRDEKGRVKRIEEAPSKSFILNLLYLWWLALNLNTSDSLSMVTYYGSPYAYPLSQPVGWWAFDNEESYSGEQVGSGTSSPSASSPYLESLILNGTGSGQLSYGSSIVTSPSLSSNPGTMTVTKTFTNNSGGTVTVGEIGLATHISLVSTASSTMNAALIIHDVLPSVANVPNGGTITVTYTLVVNT